MPFSCPNRESRAPYPQRGPHAQQKFITPHSYSRDRNSGSLIMVVCRVTLRLGFMAPGRSRCASGLRGIFDHLARSDRNVAHGGLRRLNHPVLLNSHQHSPMPWFPPHLPISNDLTQRPQVTLPKLHSNGQGRPHCPAQPFHNFLHSTHRLRQIS